MEKLETKKTTYICRFKTKDVPQVVVFDHNKTHTYQFELNFHNCTTDIKDIKILHKFLDEIIADN